MSHRPFSFVARPSAHRTRAAPAPSKAAPPPMEARTEVANTLKEARAALLEEDGEYRPRPPSRVMRAAAAAASRAKPHAPACAAEGGSASLLHPTRPQTPAPSRRRDSSAVEVGGGGCGEGTPRAVAASSPRARIHAYSPLTSRPQTARSRSPVPPGGPRRASPPPRRPSRARDEGNGQEPPQQEQQRDKEEKDSRAFSFSSGRPQAYARPTSARGHRPGTAAASPAAPSPGPRVSLADAIARTERMASHERASAADVLSLCGHLFTQRPRSADDTFRLCRLVMRQPAASAEFKAVRVQCYRGLFRLSKDAANDARLLLCADDIMSSLESLPGMPLQAFSFLISAVKNLSVSSEGQRALVDFGGVRALSSLLDEAVYAEEGAPAGGATVAARDVRARLFSEVVVILRNVSTLESEHDFVASADVVPRLCGVMERYPASGELMLNVCRVLSRVSGHVTCREQLLAHPTGLASLVSLLRRHERSVPLVVRASYVLGNVTVTCDEARARIVRDCDGVAVLWGALQHCVAEEAVIQNALERCVFEGGAVSDEDEEEEDREEAAVDRPKEGGAVKGDAASSATYAELRASEAEVVDAMVKLVRVVANVATNPDAGEPLALDRRSTLLVPLMSRAGDGADELALNAVSAVANLTYYGCGSPEGHALFEWAGPLLGGLSRAVFAASPEMLVESARALSNLSVDVGFRSHMREHHITEALVILLDHGDDNVVFAVCGALMNLATDPELSGVFERSGCAAVGKLADCLERSMGWDVEEYDGEAVEGGGGGGGCGGGSSRESLTLCDVVLKVLANLRIGAFSGGGEWVPHEPTARRLETLLLRLSEHFDDAAHACEELRAAHRYSGGDGGEPDGDEYGATGATLAGMADLCHDLLAAMAAGPAAEAARPPSRLVDAGC